MCILVYCSYFRLLIEKSTQILIFLLSQGKSYMFTPFSPCLNFSILHNFTPCFLNYIRSDFRIFSWCILMYILSCYNKCQKTNALMQLANKDYAPSSFSNDKAYRRTPYVSQKTPKAKGTYLAITESYYDKEKKATRQKTIMGLGYLEDLKKRLPGSHQPFREGCR